MGKLELLRLADENVKLYNCWGKTVWQFPKTLNSYQVTQKFHSQVNTQRNLKYISTYKKCAQVCREVLFIRTKNWKQPMCLSTKEQTKVVYNGMLAHKK